jgi:hypothetical protein
VVVVGFIGAMRSGKTLCMTIEAYKHHLQGRKIFSNYALSFPYEDVDDQLVSTVTKDNKTQVFDGSVLVFDEVHVYMDSRSSATKKNRLMSYLITQSGKLDTLILWSSQFLGQADKRLRLNTQILYKAERYVIEGGRKKLLRQDDKREDFFIDLHKYVFKEQGYKMGFMYESTKTIRKPKRYFGLYDTKERVKYTGELRDGKGET